MKLSISFTKIFFGYLVASSVGYAQNPKQAPDTVDNIDMSSDAPITTNSHTAQVIDQKLRDFPKLKNAVSKLLSYPDLPSSVRKQFERTFVNPEVSIFPLSQEIRNAYGIDSTTVAMYISTDNALRTFSKGTKTVNDDLDESMRQNSNNPEYKLPQLNLYNIFIKDEDVSWYTNQALLSLIHEISHLRFSKFLISHGQRLSEIYPEWVSVEDGKTYIYNEFECLINETYAHLIDYQSTKFLDKKSFVYSNKYGSDPLTRYLFNPDDERKATQKIMKRIINLYGITDPEVLALQGKTLWEILRGKSSKKPYQQTTYDVILTVPGFY